jgi:hypothetical protein
MTAIGAGRKWHLETKYRWVQQYNFSLLSGKKLATPA